MFYQKSRIPAVFFVSLFLFCLSLAALAVASKNSSFAAEYSSSIGALYRLIPLCVSNFVDIPLAEAALYLSPFIIVLIMIYALRTPKDSITAKRRAFKLLAFLLVFASAYISTLGVSYFKPQSAVSYNKSNIVAAAQILAYDIGKKEAEYIKSEAELSRAVELIYSSLGGDIDVLPITPKVKLARSEYLFSRLGILGAYSFPSSEILVNPAAPDHTKPFSAVHECAHLLGVAREDEADLCAFTALYSSNSAALKYSAVMSALEYLLSEIAGYDTEKYREIYSSLPEYAKRDMMKSAEFSSFSNNRLGKYAEEANDKVLSAFDPDGSGSYSRFSYLVAEYLLSESGGPA